MPSFGFVSHVNICWQIWNLDKTTALFHTQEVFLEGIQSPFPPAAELSLPSRAQDSSRGFLSKTALAQQWDGSLLELEPELWDKRSTPSSAPPVWQHTLKHKDKWKHGQREGRFQCTQQINPRILSLHTYSCLWTTINLTKGARRVSRDTWKRFMPHSNELRPIGCRLLLSVSGHSII